MKKKSSISENKDKPNKVFQLMFEMLIAVWLLIVSIQYIARYYIIIPDIDYTFAYIIMLCIAAISGIVNLISKFTSKKPGSRNRRRLY